MSCNPLIELANENGSFGHAPDLFISLHSLGGLGIFFFQRKDFLIEFHNKGATNQLHLFLVRLDRLEFSALHSVYNLLRVRVQVASLVMLLQLIRRFETCISGGERLEAQVTYCHRSSLLLEGWTEERTVVQVSEQDEVTFESREVVGLVLVECSR